MRYKDVALIVTSQPRQQAVTRFRFLELVVLFVLLGAAAYEAAIALEWIPVGPEPGENARFEGLVMTAALVALLAGMTISVVLAIRDRRSVPAALFPVAAAALMVARYYTFDTYYLPDLTRYSEGSFSPTWVYGVALGCVPAWFFSLARPRFGFQIGALVILLCLFTESLFGIGK
jgi:hypothetical protein